MYHGYTREKIVEELNKLIEKEILTPAERKRVDELYLQWLEYVEEEDFEEFRIQCRIIL